MIDEGMRALAEALRQQSAAYGFVARLLRTEVDDEALGRLRAMRFPAASGNDHLDAGYRGLCAYLNAGGERQHGEHYGDCELCLQVVVEAHEHNAQAHDPDELRALRVVDAVVREERQLHGGPRICLGGYVHEEGVGPGDEGAGHHRQYGDCPQGQVHNE